MRLLREPIESLTESGNSVLRGVRAVTTFLADLLMVSFIVHSRLLAMKKSAAMDAVESQSAIARILAETGWHTSHDAHEDYDDDDSDQAAG